MHKGRTENERKKEERKKYWQKNLALCQKGGGRKPDSSFPLFPGENSCRCTKVEWRILCATIKSGREERERKLVEYLGAGGGL